MAREARPKTYEELRQERAKEWAAAQAVAGKELGDLHDKLKKAPDVANAPELGSTWESRGIECPKCETTKFYVLRWVTVNGVRHRAELECTECSHVETWDFGMQAWLP